MKKFRIILLPAALILIGAGAAFATNAAKSSNSTSEQGYYWDSSTSRCKPSPVQCTTTPGEICTWTDNNKVTHELSSFINNTMCGDELYRLQ